jgi:transcriptional regulator with XRE-family HTH domain
MAYPFSLKEEARALRGKGYSYKEIGEMLHVTKSTAYGWTNGIHLNAIARKRINKIMTLAQVNAARTNRNRRLKRLAIVERRVNMTLSKIKPDKLLYQIVAATLYWAEGGKSSFNALQFVNSDPEMISTFLKAFRRGFKIEEQKLRCLVHIHEYHNEMEIKAFWSELTKIPLSQFSRSYLKPHTGKRTRNGYKGCINISYCSSNIAAEIHMLYNKLPQALGASFSGRTRDSKSRDGSSILSAPAEIKSYRLPLLML